MEKLKKYYGIIIFIVVAVVLLAGSYRLIVPRINELHNLESQKEELSSEVEKLNQDLTIVQNKIKRIKNSIINSQKKVYSPVESDLGNDTLFFTLYNDVIEMVHSNSVKIKSIDYTYNPESDSFVKFGKDVYFVCDVNMELVTNYVNLGKLIQDIYQYPYYIKINDLTVIPYEKDKKVLFANLSLRLYAHTSPDTQTASENNANDTANAVPEIENPE